MRRAARALTLYPSPELDEKSKEYAAFCKETLYAFQRTPQGWRFAYTHPSD